MTKNSTKADINIHLKVTKATEMNVYLYGGQSRFNATKMIVKDNGPVELNKDF